MTLLKDLRRIEARHVLLLLRCVIINFSCYSLARSTGVIFVAIIDKFHTSKSIASWVMSIFVGLFFGGAIVGGFVCARIGTIHTAIIGTFILSAGLFCSGFVNNIYVMYVTFGVIGGIGGALTIMAVDVIIQQNFSERRAFASGISAMGQATGSIVQPILQTAMVTRYGLREALFLVAGLVFFSCIISFSFKLTSKTERNNKDVSIEMKVSNKIQNDKEFDDGHSPNKDEREDVKKDKSNIKYASSVGLSLKADAEDGKTRTCKRCLAVFSFISRDFIMFIVSNFCVCLAIFTPPNLIPVMMKENGFSPDEVSLVLSVAGPADIFGKVVVGFIADYRKINRHWYIVICLLILGGMTIAIAFFGQLFQFVCYGTLYGLTTGVWVFLQPVITVDIVGVENVEHGIGLNYLLIGIGGTLGLPIAGWIVDVTGSFRIGLIITGCVFILGAVIDVPIPIITCCRKPNVAEDLAKHNQDEAQNKPSVIETHCSDVNNDDADYDTKM